MNVADAWMRTSYKTLKTFDEMRAIDDAFANMSCAQLGTERMRIQSDVLEATGQQRAARKKDQAWGWTSALLFAPAVFLMDGNEETATRLAILKGQYESIERVSAAKRCAGGTAVK